MKKKVVELAPFVEEIYKEYSLYVLQNRAIPDWSGLKRTPIKALWSATYNGRKFTKTSSLGGYITAHSNYHHAPDALIDTISKMAQDFTGSNNLPLMEGMGAFGSQTVPNGIAAPRYTELRLHKNFDVLFPTIDFNILPNSEDPENPEPLYLAPLLPITLVNGGQGIAVAYATKIFPRNIESMVDFAVTYITKKKLPKTSLLPYYNSFYGEIMEAGDKVVMCGKINKERANTVRIVEVPFKYDLEGYKNYLFKMREENRIKKIVKDDSSAKFDIVVEVDKEIYDLNDDALLDYFDLKMNMNENITIIDRDNNVKIFDDVREYLKFFIDIRLTLYKDRKNYIVDELVKKITTTIIKTFIATHLKEKKSPTKQSISDYVFKQYIKYRDFVGSIDCKPNNKKDYESESLNIINNIRLLESTSDRIDEYMEKVDALVNEMNGVREQTIESMYINELKELKKYVTAANNTSK